MQTPLKQPLHNASQNLACEAKKTIILEHPIVLVNVKINGQFSSKILRIRADGVQYNWPF